MLEFNNGKDAAILPKSDSQNRHEDVEYSGVEESYESSHGIRENLDVKKRNHLNCEKRRRENIKLSLQQLHDALPQKYKPMRKRVNEADIVLGAVNYIAELTGEHSRLLRSKALQANTVGSAEL